MSRDLNKMQLIGHVGMDPEARFLSSGKMVCTMRLATSRQWVDGGGATHEETTWHNLVAWEKLAEVANAYVQKGSRIYVEGRVQTRSWDDPEAGEKRYKTEVVLSDLILLSPRRDGGVADTLVEEEPTLEPEPAPALPAPPRRPPGAIAAPADETPAPSPGPAGTSNEPPFPTNSAPARRGQPTRQRAARPAPSGRAARQPQAQRDDDVPF